MKIKLEKDEIEILESIESGEWKIIENQSEEITRYKSYATQHLNKDKRINIRISARDLNLLKQQAIREGLPYQTFISSILHKYLNGYL